MILALPHFIHKTYNIVRTSFYVCIRALSVNQKYELRPQVCTPVTSKNPTPRHTTVHYCPPEPEAALMSGMIAFDRSATDTRSSAVADRPRVLPFIEYFAKLLEVTKGHSK